MKRIIFFLLAAITMQSCLKDDSLKVNDNTSRVIVEFTDGDSTILNTLAVNATSGDSTFEVGEIQIPMRSQFDQPVTVTVSLNPGLVQAYNDLNGTTLEVPSSSEVTFEETYTLTPEDRKVPLKITFNPENILGQTYALGFTITSSSAGEISVSKQDYIVQLVVKNQYDGIYQVTGNFIHPTNAAANGPFGTSSTGAPLYVAMVTTGENSVSRLGVAPDDIEGYDGFIFWLNTGGYLTGFTNVFPAYSIDPATNIVTVSALPGSNNQVTWNNYSSTYDPATRSFDMHYGYNSTREIFETWTYIGPR